MDTVVQVKNETPAEPGLSSLLRLFAFPWFALLFLIIILFGLVRYHLRDMPLERDEGEYAFAGQLMLQGIPPYKLAYNMKLPGTYAAYAAILAAFGDTPALTGKCGYVVVAVLPGRTPFRKTGRSCRGR